MKLLFVDRWGGDGLLDIIMKCQDDGHATKWFFKKDPRTEAYGKGIAEDIVNDWRPWMMWADLVILADNTLYLQEMDRWRAKGVRIIGATAEAATWELDRQCGQNIFKQHGIRVPDCKEFSHYDQALAYVKKEGRAFVCKPSYDEADKSLSYVSKSAADMVYMLEKWKKAKRHKGAFILQEKVSGCEMAVGGWFGPHGFNEGWCENWEFKSLMAGDRGPNVGEMGCYSADTEVLTTEGWKSWPEVEVTDNLASLVNGAVLFQKPRAVVQYDVECDMVAWENGSVDVLVTPNHNMYVQTPWGAQHKKPWRFVPAEDCVDRQFIVSRTASWTGTDQGPRIFESRYGRPKIEIDEVTWARLAGLYVAEGSASNSQVHIAGSHPEKMKKVRALLAATKLKWANSQGGCVLSSRRIAEHFKPFGRSWEKRVPVYIREARPAVIEAFLEGYALGDGNMQPNGFRVFYTCSEGLAGDVQALLLKIGRTGVVKRRAERTGPKPKIDGREIAARHPAFEVIERVKKLRSWLDKRDCRRVPYKGKVYCAEVEGHVLYVRRNGKPLWCGNTVLRFVRSSKLADKVLKPLESALEKLGYCGYVDVNCIIDDKGVPYPLEFTMRMGWPTFNIQQALIKGDHAEWLGSLAEGRDSKPFLLNQVSTGVVLALPEFPYGKTPMENVLGVPIYGLTEAMMPNVHLCEAMRQTVPVDVGGKVVNLEQYVTAGDYVLVSSGVGPSVRTSRAKAYKILETLRLPASPFWRPDIGSRLKKQLELVQMHGYARGMQF